MGERRDRPGQIGENNSTTFCRVNVLKISFFNINRLSPSPPIQCWDFDFYLILALHLSNIESGGRGFHQFLTICTLAFCMGYVRIIFPKSSMFGRVSLYVLPGPGKFLSVIARNIRANTPAARTQIFDADRATVAREN